MKSTSLSKFWFSDVNLHPYTAEAAGVPDARLDTARRRLVDLEAQLKAFIVSKRAGDVLGAAPDQDGRAPPQPALVIGPDTV